MSKYYKKSKTRSYILASSKPFTTQLKNENRKRYKCENKLKTNERINETVTISTFSYRVKLYVINNNGL